jgi:uncharacterized membrane protein YeiH
MIGDFFIPDLIASGTNALAGALLVRRPNYFKNYTVIGVILLAIAAGILGGIVRDVLLATVPAPLTNPWYIIVSLAGALIGLGISYQGRQRLRSGSFRFMLAFAMPWYAAIGAGKALSANLPIVAAILIGVIASNAGWYFLDITSGITPRQFVRGEWFVGTAVISSGAYVICASLEFAIVPSTLIAFAFGFIFRLTAFALEWEEPEASGASPRRDGISKDESQHGQKLKRMHRREPNEQYKRTGRNDRP